MSHSSSSPAPEVVAAFDPATHTISYVVADPATGAAAIIDPVLDFDPAAARTSTASVDRLLKIVAEHGWRLERVLGKSPCIHHYDLITVMSASQIPFFKERGVPESKLHVILHGVDTQYYCPAVSRQTDDPAMLKCLMVGSTERDHEFLAELMKRLPASSFQLTALTHYDYRHYYADCPNVKIPEYLDEKALLALYQQSDLLLMPMLDCTANNAILESMACGTPIMANRIGGIVEYADPSCNYLMEGKRLDEWTCLLDQIVHDRCGLNVRRQRVRKWVESFDWRRVAKEYQTLYSRLFEETRQGCAC